MNWKLKGGVIIIGSLLWQDYLDKPGDNIRYDWRNYHLDMDNLIPVMVPIRYGRESIKSDPNIVTMVFSNKMKSKPGFGYVIPFKNQVNTHDDLICDASALSKAEGMKSNFITTWSALGYLLNDNKLDSDIKKQIISIFRKRVILWNKVKDDEFDINHFKVGRERSCITKSLKLDIDWLRPVSSNDKSKLNEFDFLLASATMPTIPAPSTKRIAELVKSDMERMYFINNLKHGIITQEDFEISRLI